MNGVTVLRGIPAIRRPEAGPQRPLRVLVAAFLVGLHAAALLLGAILHASEATDLTTALLLGLGAVGTGVVAIGLLLGSRIAFVMTVAYVTVNVVLTATLAHRPALGALAILVLLARPANRTFFTRL
ncbi:hypothetical protein [Cryptosporangium phraense]|uniref:Uncharacterized protein n=1 Tax=Cryptosporangium phraense TaxID=2593070 RepID=A0A545AST4_9ACTN|nr:hypothetical protein [Cryptosporangium phraense]TQS44399.1 hypothetical protein FL583_13070 [Cryptosporangium phraense]